MILEDSDCNCTWKVRKGKKKEFCSYPVCFDPTMLFRISGLFYRFDELCLIEEGFGFALYL